ncbi:hypothetical protein TIFTF001_037804 [Ficus carica]|uniref:Uncharacterized protein n=1 Tax=Ficus carica TaxID=3494 RepID=A0AA88JC80_FICCA|nr:hypothetical protein TIFTF001_037804 [Ficus carica]
MGGGGGGGNVAGKFGEIQILGGGEFVPTTELTGRGVGARPGGESDGGSTMEMTTLRGVGSRRRKR